MPLVEVELALDAGDCRPKPAVFIAERENALPRWKKNRGRRFQHLSPVILKWSIALAALQAAQLATGRRFIEWGSGVGVVSCLAALGGFDAVGIEIETSLVDIAEELAADHGIAVQFARGSFVPPGAEPSIDLAGDVAWLSTEGDDGYAELELEPDDFDVVFAYPWPGEEQVIFDLFADTSSVGRYCSPITESTVYACSGKCGAPDYLSISRSTAVPISGSRVSDSPTRMASMRISRRRCMGAT